MSSVRCLNQVRPAARTIFAQAVSGGRARIFKPAIGLEGRLSSKPAQASRTYSHFANTRHILRSTRPRWSNQYQGLLRGRRSNSGTPSPHPTPELGSPKPSLKDQLKRLTKEYGRGAIIVYLIFSALDLPFAYALVQLVGPERVGAAEHAVLGWFKGAWDAVNPMADRQAQAQTIPARQEQLEESAIREGLLVGNDAAEAVKAAKEGNASIWTQLALAYAIHKSLFIFIRIPLTVAFTPKIVKTMRAQGGFLAWLVGGRKAM